MQFSMVSVALPSLIADLDAPLRWVGWVVTIYTLAQAVSMPIAGKLSDELGRRRVFAGGVALFGVASLACALAPNIWILIAGRAVQGLAGGSLLPSAYGIIGDTYEGQRAQALGLISSVFPVGSILGPNLGGLIVDTIGWRWTFALNVPLTMVVIVTAMLAFSADGLRERSRIDVPGAALLALSVIGLVYALTELGTQTGSPNLVIVTAALAVAVGAGFALVRFELHTPSPAIDFTLLQRREFAFLNALNFFYGIAVFGVFAFIPLYAQTAYGMSSSETGFLLTPRAIVMIAVSAIASLLLPRTGYRRPIVLGLFVMAFAMVLLSAEVHEFPVAGWDPSEFTVVATIVAVAGVGLASAGPAANNAAIELAPDRVAAITGMRGMFRSLGGAIGTSLIVLISSIATDTQTGLEMAFAGLAVLTVLTSLLVVGIPDEVGAAVQTIPRRERETSGVRL